MHLNSATGNLHTVPNDRPMLTQTVSPVPYRKFLDFIAIDAISYWI